MNTKRFVVLIILGLFLVSMMAGVFAADYSGEAAGAAETVITSFSGFFGTFLPPLIGDKKMVSRVLFALLLGMIIYSIIAIMFSKSSNYFKWGITGAITFLALLGLPSQFLEVIRTQYSAMGATILTIIPFLIVIAFTIKSNNLVVARLTWIFYAIYYFAVYAYEATTRGGFFTTESMPYGIAFFVGIIIFFGIERIRRVITKGEIEGLTERGLTKVQQRKALQGVQDADLERYNS